MSGAFWTESDQLLDQILLMVRWKERKNCVGREIFITMCYLTHMFDLKCLYE